jgi:hypothetical protein
LELLEAYAKEYPDRNLTPQIDDLIADLKRAVEEEEQEVTPPPPAPEPVEPAQASPGSTSESEVSGKEEAERARRIVEITGWTGVGLGAASFVAAVVFQGVAAVTRNKARDATTYNEFLDLKEKNAAFQTGATSTFVASALLAGLGIAQLALVREGGKDGDEASVSIAPGLGWIGVKGEF